MKRILLVSVTSICSVYFAHAATDGGKACCASRGNKSTTEAKACPASASTEQQKTAEAKTCNKEEKKQGNCCSGKEKSADAGKEIKNEKELKQVQPPAGKA